MQLFAFYPPSKQSLVCGKFGGSLYVCMSVLVLSSEYRAQIYDLCRQHCDGLCTDLCSLVYSLCVHMKPVFGVYYLMINGSPFPLLHGEEPGTNLRMQWLEMCTLGYQTCCSDQTGSKKNLLTLFRFGRKGGISQTLLTYGNQPSPLRSNPPDFLF